MRTILPRKKKEKWTRKNTNKNRYGEHNNNPKTTETLISLILPGINFRIGITIEDTLKFTATRIS